MAGAALGGTLPLPCMVLFAPGVAILFRRLLLLVMPSDGLLELTVAAGALGCTFGVLVCFLGGVSFILEGISATFG